ncbi:hypothetical protein D3C75_579630 [compost metagenome]
MLAGIGGNDLLRHQGLMLQHLQYRSIHPVIIALCKRAALLGAEPFLTEAGFLFGCQCNGMQMKAACNQQQNRLLRCKSGNCLSGQVEDTRRDPLAQRFYRREEGRHRFADPCRCLGEQINTFSSGLIYSGSKMPLSLPVILEWKSQPADTLFPPRLMTHPQLRIRRIAGYRFGRKGLKLLPPGCPVQAVLRLTASQHIGKLDYNRRKLLIHCDHIGVHKRLRPVNLSPFHRGLQRSGYGLDLLYNQAAILSGQQAVTASVDDKKKSLIWNFCLKVDLFAVPLFILLLDMLMNTRAFRHRRTAAETRLQTAAAEGILHQRSYRKSYLCIVHVPSSFPLPARLFCPTRPFPSFFPGLTSLRVDIPRFTWRHFKMRLTGWVYGNSDF